MVEVSALNYPADLPIVAERDRIVQAIRAHRVVIIAGDTGSGKTTQLPKMCLEAGRGREKRIGCTQPRRIAAVSVANRVAQELGEAGGLVGYKIRFQDKTSRATRIKFMTDGMLLAETQQDRFLNGYDTIIVDEAHERSLNIDFLLGILKRLLARREDLKLIITSATIDTEKFAKSFDNAPIIQVSGRLYPVEVRYQGPENEMDEEEGGEQTYVDRAVEAVLDLRKNEPPGDLLVFMPTERDIRETESALSKALELKRDRVEVLPLFGRMSVAEQNRIFRATPHGKIVIATNIAETSVTVPGIRYVVDTGLARLAIYNPRARTSKLPVLPISRASADQRKGRCGRVGPGVCIRLYSEENYQNRSEFTPPEIQRSNLAEVVLRMIHLRLGAPAEFPFIDPPTPRAVKDGYSLLHELGAVRSSGPQVHQVQLTDTGRLMARLPLDPRISRMIIEAREQNGLREVMVIAAALSIQDPRLRPEGQEKAADEMHARFVEPRSDFLTLLNIWDAYHDLYEKLQSQSKVRKFCKSHFLSFQRMREWRDIHEQIATILGEEAEFLVNVQPAPYDAVHRALLSGNLRTIGMKKEKNIYLGGQSKELMVFPGSALFNRAGQWIMAAELVETSRLFARTVATIKPEWIEPLARQLCRYSYSDPHWEKKAGRVMAFEKVTLFGLVLEAQRRVNFGRIKPAEARTIFIREALVAGEVQKSFPFLDHNLALIRKHQQLEERLRQRDILVDDQTLYDFYDQRLGEEVWDLATLAGYLKKQGGDKFLWMSETDILVRKPQRGEMRDFPEQLPMGEISLALHYRFEPGSEEDGVSVHIPVALLPQVDPLLFDWLVPGLLQEKVVFLLKGLPKQLRKQLIPVAQTAGELMNELTPYQGSLCRSLEAAIYQRFRLKIEHQQWPLDALPNQLRMRFCLTDAKGKVIKASRNFAELSSQQARVAAAATDLDGLRSKWERQGLRQWDFAELPERIPIKDRAGNLGGFACPALVAEEGGSVGVRLCASDYEARKLSRHGLLALYCLEMPKQCKAAKKDFALPRNYWALYEGLGSHEEINEQLIAFILTQLFAAADGHIPGKEQFAARLARLKQGGLYAPGREIFDQVVELLRERRETLDVIARFEQMAGKSVPEKARFSGYRQQVAMLLPPHFLSEFDLARLRKTPRYFKALRVRVERAHAGVTKDEAKAVQVAPYEERLANIEKKLEAAGRRAVAENVLLAQRRQLIDEFREMIEEFKISLFAPEIKTAFPVSPKRLDQKWQEVEKLF